MNIGLPAVVVCSSLTNVRDRVDIGCCKHLILHALIRLLITFNKSYLLLLSK